MNISETFFHSLAERGPCDETQAACLAALDGLGLPYAGLTHDPADTIALCEEIEQRLGAPIVKNLFLCNQQKTAFYLLLMPGNKVFKTKYLSKQIGSARLSFADADSMRTLLGVQPGSVSVFGLLNDKERRVKLIVDEELTGMDEMGFHPCRNTATVKVRRKDLTDLYLPCLGLAAQLVALPRELTEG